MADKTTKPEHGSERLAGTEPTPRTPGVNLERAAQFAHELRGPRSIDQSDEDRAVKEFSERQRQEHLERKLGKQPPAKQADKA